MSFSSVEVVLMFVCAFVYPARSQTQFCEDYQSCAGDTIAITGSLYCRGAISCQSSNLHVDSSVYCHSQQSCHEANIYADANYAFCYGQYSCEDADINPEVGALCYGYASCYDSSMNIELLYAFGPYSAHSAFISSWDYTEANYRFYGYYAGYAAHIYCASYSTCNIRCRGNGCYLLTIWKSNSATVVVTSEPNEDCVDQPTQMLAPMTDAEFKRFADENKHKAKENPPDEHLFDDDFFDEDIFNEDHFRLPAGDDVVKRNVFGNKMLASVSWSVVLIALIGFLIGVMVVGRAIKNWTGTEKANTKAMTNNGNSNEPIDDFSGSEVTPFAM